MVFSSISFLLFFLPCLLVCYFLVPQRFRNLRNMVLLAFSLIFYGWGGPSFLLLMLASIALNYICGLFCGGKKLPKWVRAMSVFIAVAGGIGMLGYFKYAGFMAEIVNKLGFMVPIPEVVLPIGISFYTFQGLSYVIDVYYCLLLLLLLQHLHLLILLNFLQILLFGLNVQNFLQILFLIFLCLLRMFSLFRVILIF